MSVTRFENKTKVADITPNIDEILNAIYPIGVIVCGAKPTVGTWEKVEGRFLLGSSSSHAAGSTGGEETHKLTEAEMPIHNHNIMLGWNNGGSGPDTIGYASNNQGARAYQYNTGGSGVKALQDKGGGQAHNNMPPYLSVDMWRRTA